MADLPLLQTPQLQRTGGSAVQANAGALTAPLSAASQAIERIGGQATDFIIQRQRLKDDAALARTKLANQAAEAEVQRAMLEEPDESKWTDLHDAAWEARREAFSSEISGLSNAAQERAQLEFDADMQQARIKVDSQQTQRSIKRDNAAIVNLAQTYADRGDRESAIAELNKLNMNPMQVERMTRQVMQQGVYQETQNILNSAKTIDEHEGFLEMLMETDDEGNFTNFFGLEINGRRYLQNVAESRIRAKRNDIRVARDRAVSDVASGKKTALDVRNDILESGGSEQEAVAVSQIVQSTARAEENTRAFESLSDDISRTIWNTDRAPNEFQDLLTRIAEEKDLSRQSKLKLFQMWTNAYASDVNDGQVEYEGFWGREVSLDDADKQMMTATFDALKLLNRRSDAPLEAQGALTLDIMRDFIARKKAGGDMDHQEILNGYMARIAELEVGTIIQARTRGTSMEQATPQAPQVYEFDGTQQGWDQIPSGAQFRHPDGTIRTKP